MRSCNLHSPAGLFAKTVFTIACAPFLMTPALARDDNQDNFARRDFHNARIDVFEGAFKPVQAPGGFVDPHLPQGYAPFGIRRSAAISM